MTTNKVPVGWAVLSWWPVGWILTTVALATQYGWWAMMWLVFAPPLLSRLFGKRCMGRHPVMSREALLWWFQYQLQQPFSRIPLFEDMLRLVPGAWSLWVSLWGGRVSPWSHWAPGVVVTDRQLLVVGSAAVIGAGALLGTHAVVRDELGEWWVLIGPVTVGPGSVVGARCVLGPSSTVGAGETLPATWGLPPGNTWIRGKRMKPHE